MIIKEAKFISSNTRADLCPKTDLPEYAFIGRSNVGKSSLINMLTNRLKLAKTSSFPGKTQLINHFLINNEWYLVDLPGYGWAKVSKSSRESWEKMIRYYLQNRPNLACVFVLIDSRLPAQKNDLEFMALLGNMGVPFVIIFTKIDKQSGPKTDANIAAYVETLRKEWEELPQMLRSSSATKQGREQILNFIQEVNKQYREQPS